MTTTTARRGYHHGDLRAALCAAALELVTERGPAAVTLAEAARRAGVSGSAPYRHFADREQLLAAVAAEAFDRLAAALAACTGATPADRLVAMVRAYVRFAQAEPARFAVLFGAGLDKTADPAVAAAGERVFAVVVEAAGAVRPGDAAAGALALTVWAVAHGHAALLADGALAAHGVGPGAALEAAVHAAVNVIASG